MQNVRYWGYSGHQSDMQKCPLMTQSGHERWSSGPIFKVAFVLSGDQLHVGRPENLRRMAFGSYSVLAARKPMPPYRLTGRTAVGTENLNPDVVVMKSAKGWV
jgi:hypothetical protein